LNNEREVGGRVDIVQIAIGNFANSLKIWERWGNSNALRKNDNYRKPMVGGGNAGV
jgi:hypothetical protein